MLNVGNMFNSDWGVGQRLVSNQPLLVTAGAQADAQGRAQYRLRSFNDASGVPQLMSTSFQPTTFLGDVYRFQIMLRYQF
jgi:hypothetical protein